MTTPKSQQSAFTLIELLVVIVIIAILATAALPIYLIIQDKANSSVSRTNLRTIGGVLYLYQGDNNMCFPAIDGDSSIPDLDNWVSELVIAINQETPLPELISNPITKTFVSPGLRWKSSGGFYDNAELLNTYAATEALAGLDDKGSPDPELKRRPVTIESQGQTIILVEARQSGSNPYCEPWIDWNTASSDFGLPPEDTQTIDFRYSDEVNVLMADGSAKTMSAKELAEIKEWNWSGDRYPKKP